MIIIDDNQERNNHQGVQAVEGKTGRVRRTLIDFSIARYGQDKNMKKKNSNGHLFIKLKLFFSK